MKATDLMIGDWVLISVWDCNPFPSKVTSINYNSYQGKDYVDWIDTEDEEEIGMYIVQPIPLTPEILEKNGFPYNNKERLYYPFSNKAFAIERDEHDDQVFYYSMYVYNPYSSFNWHEIIEIRYVHELQHALRLCGIDKEIVL